MSEAGRALVALHAARPPVSGPVGDLANYGREILNHTPRYMKGFVRADMSCSACHLQSCVRHNMPLGSPNTLTAQESYDVAAFVRSHPRPAFDKNATIAFPPMKAEFF